MNVGILYAITAFISLLQVLVIYNRTKATQYKETVEKPFCRMLIFFMFFTIVDCIWGIYESHTIFFDKTMFAIFTYLFHAFAALSAFFWFGYVVFYVKSSKKETVILNIFRLVFITVQLGLLISNIWTHKAFAITEADAEYVPAFMRTVTFLLQFSYYIIFTLFILYKLIFTKPKSEYKQLYLRAILFSIIPLAFGLGQLKFYDASMYSLGFAFASFAIYSFNITAQREKYLDIKRKEESIITRERENELKNQAKTLFLFNMSHDIRTPMNAIIGYTNMLEKYRFDDEKFNNCLVKVKDSGQHLLSIINSILEMSRIEAGKETYDDSEICDIYSFFKVTDTILGSDIKKKNLTLTTSDKLKHRYIYGDSTKIKEVFLNILSNSVKYTNEYGYIDVYCEELPHINPAYIYIRTVITDNGIGMSEEFLPHIFDSFERERSSTESKTIGTGLGMGIVKKLLDLMDGDIKIESKLNEGTKVTITIPHKLALENEVESTENGDDSQADNFEGVKVLIAEDNEMNAEILTDILNDYGIIADVACNGEECINMLNSASGNEYKIIFMDVQMPKMDGYQATKAIRNMDDVTKKFLPIIAMTANAFDSDQKKALEAGMNDFLSKPIDLKLLNKVLKKWLDDQE